MIIKSKGGLELLDIPAMHRIALDHIFNEKSVTYIERIQLEDSIEFWSKCQDTNKEFKWELKRIVNALVANERGFFDRSKMLQIEHKVDYKKMYRGGLPFINIDNRTSFSKK